jgi:hypothetical protein
MPKLGHPPGFSQEGFMPNARGKILGNLNGDLSAELGIQPQENFSESPGTKQSLDFVPAKMRGDSQLVRWGWIGVILPKAHRSFVGIKLGICSLGRQRSRLV